MVVLHDRALVGLLSSLQPWNDNEMHSRHIRTEAGDRDKKGGPAGTAGRDEVGGGCALSGGFWV